MALCGLGVILERRGYHPQAEACYEAALQADPRNPAAHNNLGLALQARGDVKGAEARFRDALRSDPNLAEAHANLGFALLDSQKGCRDRDRDGAAAAEASFLAALQVEPASSAALAGRGML